MSIALVQQIGSASSTPTVTRTLNGVAAGNTLVVCFSCGVASINNITVSDNNGNTWAIAESLSYNDTFNHTIGIAYVSTANAGNTTMTITNSGGQPIQANMSEWNSGVPGAALFLDQAAVGSNTGAGSTSITTASVTLTNSVELLIAMIENNAGGLTAGLGFTGFSSPSSDELPEYQVVTGGGSVAGTATGTSGKWGAVLATFLILPLPVFNTPAGRFNTAGTLVGGLLVPIWTAANVTPVTVNANTTSDQDLMSSIVPANTLNSVGRTLRVKIKGVYSTPAASTATITIKVQLGTLTLLEFVTAANAGSVTNNGFLVEADITVQTAGTLAQFESSGKLEIDLGAAQSSAASVYVDSNSAVSSTLDSTQNQPLQITIAFSAGSTSNSATQRQMIQNTVN